MQKLRLNCIRSGGLMCDLNAKNVGAFTWRYIYKYKINQMYSLTSKCLAEITVMGMRFS